MRRIIATIGLLALFAAVPYAASVWTPIAEKLNESTVFLESLNSGAKTGSCTGFVIHEEKKHILTANHCFDEKVLADGTPTYVLYRDDRFDLMVLRASQLDRPAVVVAKEAPKRGDQVASMGYGFGLVDPMFRVSHVSNVDLQIESLASRFIMVDSEYIGGQSGGALVNDQGEVVGIVQRSSSGLGIGVGADVIRSRVGRYIQ